MNETQLIGNILVLCGLAIAVLALAPSYLQVIANKNVPRKFLGALNYVFAFCFSDIAFGSFYLMRSQDYPVLVLIGAPIVCIIAIFTIIYLSYRSYTY